MALLVTGCAAKGEHGSCDDADDCQGSLECIDGICAVGARLHSQMAKQSGVAVQSEKPSLPGGVPGAVRIRSATGRAVAVAMCDADERLIGGWCRPPGAGSDNTSFTKSSVVGHSETDTIGAHWKCNHEGVTVEANAICQKLPTVTPPVPEPPATASE